MNLLNRTQMICLTLFIVLAGTAYTTTDNGVPKCDTLITKHLDKSQGQCK